MAANFKELSRADWINKTTPDSPTDMQLVIGCLQRIANALERNNTLIDQSHQIMLEKRKNIKLRKELKQLKGNR